MNVMLQRMGLSKSKQLDLLSQGRVGSVTHDSLGDGHEHVSFEEIHCTFGIQETWITYTLSFTDIR